MPPAHRNIRHLSWVFVAVAGAALCVLIGLSPRRPVYDETWFLGTLDLLNRRGLSVTFLREFPGAPGPTFTLLFAGIDHVAGLGFPWLRFINVALLVGAVMMIWRILKATPKQLVSADAGLIAAHMAMLPTVGVSAGMALTEMPALFFITASVWLLALARADGVRQIQSWLSAIACGATIAAAILGRQNYLVALPCLLLAFDWSAKRRDFLHVVTIIGIVAVITLPVFILWGGLTPPLAAWSRGDVSPANVIRSAGYAGLITLLLAPEIFRVLQQRKTLLAAVAILSLPIALALGTATAPAAMLIESAFGHTLTSLIAASFSFVLAFSAICFVGCFSFYIWQERMNWLTRFAGSTALLGILSNAMISHQFSSRYVFVFLPFIAMATAPAVRMNWHQPLRLAIGASLSLGALASYYFG